MYLAQPGRPLPASATVTDVGATPWRPMFGNRPSGNFRSPRQTVDDDPAKAEQRQVSESVQCGNEVKQPIREDE